MLGCQSLRLIIARKLSWRRSTAGSCSLSNGPNAPAPEQFGAVPCRRTLGFWQVCQRGLTRRPRGRGAAHTVRLGLAHGLASPHAFEVVAATASTRRRHERRPCAAEHVCSAGTHRCEVSDCDCALARGGVPVRPLMSAKEVALIGRQLRPHHVMLEWGSGGSELTVTWQVFVLNSIEHEARWCVAVKCALDKPAIRSRANVDVRCVAPEDPSRLKYGFQQYPDDGVLKLACNFPATSLQLPCNFPTTSPQLSCNFPTISLQLPHNFPTTSLQLPYNCPTTALQLSHSFPATSLQLPCTFPAPSLKLPYNFPQLPYNFPITSPQLPYTFSATSLKLPYNFPTTFSQLPYNFPTTSLQLPYTFPTTSLQLP